MATPLFYNFRVRRVILDTAAAGFQAEVTKLAMRTISLGDPVYGASCVGVGKGSNNWSEEELKPSNSGLSVGSPVAAMTAALSGSRSSRQ